MALKPITILTIFTFAISCIVVGFNVDPPLSACLILLVLLIAMGLATYLLSRAYQIPTEVKNYVFKRDGGRCNRCGATGNLVYDRITPNSGSNADNIQLLCQTCSQLKQNIMKLNDLNISARWQAVWALRSFRDKQAIEPLGATSVNDRNPRFGRRLW